MSARLIKGLPFHSRGKGKDLYEIPGHPDLLLLVFRDSLSTHNVPHITEPARKGEIIAALTVFMHLMVLDGIPNHIEEFGRDIYNVLPRRGTYPANLHHRAFVVRRARKPEVEFIFRAFLMGSLARTLKEEGTDPYGLCLCRHLPLMYRFTEPMFTPTEKSETDAPLKAGDVCSRYPVETALALQAFLKGQAYLRTRGLELIDAKFEFSDGVLVDDWLNGDCARMARQSDVREGEEPPFLDKEVFRQIAIRAWDGGPHIPLVFTEEEVRQGMRGYYSGFELITDMTLQQFQETHLDV
jgi:phosphoribosylaminoimidazole-succinocarboxamide synthase